MKQDVGNQRLVHIESTQIRHLYVDEMNSNESDMHVENFSVAVSFWMMIKLIQYVSFLNSVEVHLQEKQSISETTRKNNHSESLLDTCAHENAAAVIQQESAPWLLFAIIWHLAMIREHGAVQSTQSNTKVKQKVKAQKNMAGSFVHSTTVSDILFLQQGVIYVFGS